jgi:hypothetical protein
MIMRKFIPSPRLAHVATLVNGISFDSQALPPVMKDIDLASKD